MGVRVVTDSACDLPQDLVEQLGIEIVPLTIRFGNQELVDRKELGTGEFWRRLARSPVLPETSAPSAGAFEEVFRRLAVFTGGFGFEAAQAVSEGPLVEPYQVLDLLTLARLDARRASIPEVIDLSAAVAHHLDGAPAFVMRGGKAMSPQASNPKRLPSF